jgi:ribonucleotide monophosphatase NagD (HAD superfamily)
MIVAFVDLDGTLRPTSKKVALFPHALNLLRTLISRNVDVYITTNNTLQTPEQIKQMYFKDIDCTVLSPLSTAKKFFQQNNTVPYIVGNKSTDDYFKDLRFTPEIKQNGVYLANNVFGDYNHLKNIFERIQECDYYVAENSYTTTVDHCGEIDAMGALVMPDVGALIHMIKTITDKEPKVVFGKPNLHMVEDLLESGKYTDCMVIGDSPNDKNFAKNIRSAHTDIRVSLFEIEDDEDLEQLCLIIKT